MRVTSKSLDQAVVVLPDQVLELRHDVLVSYCCEKPGFPMIRISGLNTFPWQRTRAGNQIRECVSGEPRRRSRHYSPQGTFKASVVDATVGFTGQSGV